MNYRFETETKYPIDLVEWSRKRQAEIDAEAERQRRNMQQTMTMLGVLGAYGKDWNRKKQLANAALGAEARDYYDENWAPYGTDAVTLASLGFNPSMWKRMNPNGVHATSLLDIMNSKRDADGVQIPEPEPDTLDTDNSWLRKG